MREGEKDRDRSAAAAEAITRTHCVFPTRNQIESAAAITFHRLFSPKSSLTPLSFLFSGCCAVRPIHRYTTTAAAIRWLLVSADNDDVFIVEKTSSRRRWRRGMEERRERDVRQVTDGASRNGGGEKSWGRVGGGREESEQNQRNGEREKGVKLAGIRNHSIVGRFCMHNSARKNTADWTKGAGMHSY